MKRTLPWLLALGMSVPVGAQARRPAPRPAPRPTPPPLPKVAFRPFFTLAAESFSAKQSFDAVFGQSVEPFYGGGLEIALRNGVYVDVAGSRFKKTGERAFRFNGQNFGLGIPLTAAITPVEITGGYRFRTSPRVFPYVGAGVGSYSYTETSAFSDAGDDASVRHAGYLAVGGVDFRVHRYVGIAGDVQFTHVPGILGREGISQDAGENDLGGLALRLKVTVGK